MAITTSSRTASQAETLARDFRNVVADAQELLKAIGTDGDAKLNEVKARAQKSLNDAKVRLGELQDTIEENALAAAKSTDEYVRENPWHAVGITAAIGVLIGFLIARR
jgi:ElaB/YqjD/DUF883 family membrane-anchored ribosome-binding protein